MPKSRTRAVRSGSAVFAQTCLFENLGSLRYWLSVRGGTWQNLQNHEHRVMTQVSLPISPAWSVFAAHVKKLWVLGYSQNTKCILIRQRLCTGSSESLCRMYMWFWQFCQAPAQLCPKIWHFFVLWLNYDYKLFQRNVRKQNFLSSCSRMMELVSKANPVQTNRFSLSQTGLQNALPKYPRRATTHRSRTTNCTKADYR